MAGLPGLRFWGLKLRGLELRGSDLGLGSQSLRVYGIGFRA